MIQYLYLLYEVIWNQAASPSLVADLFIAAAHNRSTYLPDGASVHTHQIHDSLCLPHLPLQMAAQSVQLFLHGRCHIRSIRYILWKDGQLGRYVVWDSWSGGYKERYIKRVYCADTFPQNLPLTPRRFGDLGTRLRHGSL